MAAVPTFSLYGESDRVALGDWLHCESIPARSGRYDWEIAPHRHPHFFQILYLTGGSGECLLEGRRARLVPCTAVTAPPGAVHGFRFSETVEGWVLSLMADRIATAVEGTGWSGALAAPQLVPMGRSDASQAVAGCLEMIGAELAERRPGRDTVIEAQIRTVLVLLGRERSGAPRTEAPSSALGRRAEQFRRLLGQHFRAERSLAFYAGRMGVSETHLNRVCQAAIGRSALSVIHDRIMEEASRDLTFTTMSVNEIARSLGFDDPAYFSRFFARRAGLSPRRYRRAAAGATRAG